MNFEHILETFLTSTVPIVIYLWNNRRQAKAENQKKHQENIAVQESIAETLRWHPPHKHSERVGPLTAEGIDYPPVNGLPR